MILLPQKNLKIKNIMNKENVKRRTHLSDGIIIGLLLMAVGCLLLAFNAGLLLPEWKPVIISWPMLGVVIGILFICKRWYIAGLVPFFFSAYALIPKFRYIYPDNQVLQNFEPYYWASFFIILGILIIFLPSRFKSKMQYRKNRCQSDHQTINGEVNINASFAEMEEVVLDPVFKGGKVDVSFGEVTLDLRHTTLADETVELNVSCVFAEVNMLIPEDWNVRIEKQLSFGSINDKRILSRKPIDMNKELVINIYCKFGGCLIK